MKVWKRGKKRMRVTPEHRYMPVGYYKNRPKLLKKIREAGMGRVESIRFIKSIQLL